MLVENDIDPDPLSKDDYFNQFFPSTILSNWSNWHWQIKNKITSIDRLSKIIELTAEEKEVITVNKSFPFAITPYYLKIIYDNPQSSLRKTIIPTIKELNFEDCENEDPLHEKSHSPCKCIVHRYPDRVLFLTTSVCSTYCRYCTRSRVVGKTCITTCDWIDAIDYIKTHTEVRDVLLSGGDPLTLQNDSIDWLLSQIRAIKHVEIIRIGTKVPVVLPQRLYDKELLNILKQYHPLFMSLHFVHPDELSKETVIACSNLANAGVPLGSQTVLLKDVNDNVELMTKLMQGLLKIRVKPYYLYQCDPILGSSHFRTKVEKGIEIIKNLRGFTSGYAVPTFVIDAPGGGGKIPVMPEYVIESNNTIILKNYENNIYHYPNG
jgi:lysine 2,3-aminomutase